MSDEAISETLKRERRKLINLFEYQGGNLENKVLL
jgi:hypothetical protein